MKLKDRAKLIQLQSQNLVEDIEKYEEVKHNNTTSVTYTSLQREIITLRKSLLRLSVELLNSGNHY